MSFANFDYEAQKPLKKDLGVVPEDEMSSLNELDKIINNTSKQLELFGSLISQFDLQRKQIGTRRDNTQLRDNLDQIIVRVSQMESAIHVLIENISFVINRSQRHGVNTTTKDEASKLIITNRQVVVKERLESELSDLHKQFQVMTRSYKEKKRSYPIKEHPIATTANIPSETTPLILDQSQTLQQQQQQQIQEEEINETELQYHLMLTEERNQEIGQINEGILEINSIFKDLGELVNQQGEQLDTIEDNILQLHGNSQQAESELVKANEYQRKKGKWSCIILVALCVFVLVIVLAVIS